MAFSESDIAIALQRLGVTCKPCDPLSSLLTSDSIGIVFRQIEAWASISFMTFLTQPQNGVGFYSGLASQQCMLWV